MASSFELRFVESPLEEAGDCFKFVYDGRHLVTGHDNLPHEDLIEKLELVTGQKADRPSLTLGWVWARAMDASYAFAYGDDRNPDIELQLEKWLRKGRPDDARNDMPSARQ